jgi:hypothetical protein
MCFHCSRVSFHCTRNMENLPCLLVRFLCSMGLNYFRLQFRMSPHCSMVSSLRHCERVLYCSRLNYHCSKISLYGSMMTLHCVMQAQYCSGEVSWARVSLHPSNKSLRCFAVSLHHTWMCLHFTRGFHCSSMNLHCSRHEPLLFQGKTTYTLLQSEPSLLQGGHTLL